MIYQDVSCWDISCTFPENAFHWQIQKNLPSRSSKQKTRSGVKVSCWKYKRFNILEQPSSNNSNTSQQCFLDVFERIENEIHLLLHVCFTYLTCSERCWFFPALKLKCSEHVQLIEKIEPCHIRVHTQHGMTRRHIQNTIEQTSHRDSAKFHTVSLSNSDFQTVKFKLLSLKPESNVVQSNSVSLANSFFFSIFFAPFRRSFEAR